MFVIPPARWLSVVCLLAAVAGPVAAQPVAPALRGQVLNAESRAPVVGATVTIEERPVTNAVTDATGSFTLAVPAGVVHLLSLIHI